MDIHSYTKLKINNHRHFYPLFCGYQSCSPGYSFGPAMREYYLLHFCIEGKGEFFADNICHSIQKGQGFLICPGDLTFYQANSIHPWSYIWVALEGDMVNHFLSLCGLSRNSPVITCPHIDKLHSIILEMLNHHTASFADELYNQGLLYQFFSYLSVSSSAPEPPIQAHESAYITKAIEYIQFHYQSPVTVQEIADYLSLNRCYLTTLFKKNVNLSPQQFLKNYRISKATELLTHTPHLVRNIAYSCGYTNELAFTKAFKSVIGTSPTQYRKGILSPPDNI